ncbi:glycoside hydrolase family 48 protein [Inconstantimicrobium porci]|uniref:glycoside hydrolase family 48 protein n=1 Tax=Inconstantimicrobium porci TaxID=2652291 RepID=UPI002409FF29|nr:glycoside hydrolase family 48 protein [Inconstantimicrobium porci]MDD6769629.1 glycoside hydrolase family 48 protein [Inconstantimicrobium porci]
MKKSKLKIILASAVCGLVVSNSLLGTGVKAKSTENKQDIYAQRFLELRSKISDPKNGYYRTLNEDGKELKIPYHCRETFICEGPDYGHETTSETFSYYLWLEAMYGKFSGDWSAFNKAWDSTEKYMIPSHNDQPNNSYYKSEHPADMANEYLSTSKYPSEINKTWEVGKDDLSAELKNEYKTDDMYGMHWLLDTDNWYGYGKHGADGKSGYDKTSLSPVFINTYQRGTHESAFKTVTHPSWDDCKTYGSDDKNSGFLSLFTKNYIDPGYTHQWRYTIASDADARAIQATYWANKWAKDSGDGSAVKEDTKKATKLGDYLRYSMFDKYFRNIGSGNGQDQGTNKHYLLGWYYSWGGDTDKESWGGSWAWRIGCSHNHFGYQNPMAAWVLSSDKLDEKNGVYTKDFTSNTANGKKDWDQSLKRQVELYQWLQSDEGAIAGGCTNSYTTDQGSYQKYPEGTPTFYGMAYDEAPVYLDPPSNRWFGMQVWSLQRLAEYYYQTGDKTAQAVLNKWAKWAIKQIHLKSDGTFEIPANLKWSGKPDTWNGSYTGNKGLHVEVETVTGSDVGVNGSLANTLSYISAANKKYDVKTEEIEFNGKKEDVTTTCKNAAKEILDRMWNKDADSLGLSAAEDVEPAKYFENKPFIPDGWTGKMGNGDTIKSGVNFLDIRSKYKLDPDYKKFKDAYDNGEKSIKMTYHRYWGQVDAALAYGTYSILFKDDKLLGDVNDDGVVDSADYIKLKNFLRKNGKGIKINQINADVNEDNKVNASDLAKLKTMI